jgi:y4mF family transcriptional regulator
MTSIQTPQQLGEAIRTARKQLALTQPQLALAAGVGVRFVVELEAGKPTVQLALVLRVIQAFGCEIHIDGFPEASV